MPRRIAVQEAADMVADEVNRLIDSPAKKKKRVLHVAQLRKAANSVSANIAEGLGRGEGGRAKRQISNSAR